MKTHLAVVVLAAGQGKRLGGKSQKVVRKILGKPILLYLLNTIENLAPDRVIIIVGYKKEEVFEQLKDRNVQYAEQNIPRGTGDAVLQARKALRNYEGDILILCGDIPFISQETLSSLVSAHKKNKNCGTILTAVIDNPTGYGRIKRNEGGNVQSIVEELNATESERAIREVNAGIYVFNKKKLFSALDRLLPDAVKKEYYLTDVVSMLSLQGEKIGTYTTERPDECLGINSIEDIERAKNFLIESGTDFDRKPSGQGR